MGLSAKGETPIAASLKQAGRSFAALKGQSNRVILVTDGIEECQGDPCAAAQALKDSGLDLKVDIVGFTLNDAQRKTIECVSKTTGGQYYDAQDTKSLATALASVKEDVEKTAPPKAMTKPKEAMLTILSSPDNVWPAMIDGKTDNVAWLWTGQEAVYGFKDRRAATFDTFGVFIPAAGAYPKQFEILVGDDSPTGQFRSLGMCDIANMGLKNAPYQQCKFDPVTAHFVKIKLTDTVAGDHTAYATEIQLNATLEPESSALAAPAGTTIAGATNLLSAGSLESSSSDVWPQTVDGKPDSVAWMWEGQEAVYSFGNGQSAEFDTFAVAINGQGANAKSFELLVGDNGPLGDFRSVGMCELANARMVPDVFQQCHFAPVTAKYLKVKLASTIAGDHTAYGTEFKLLGKIVPNSSTPREGAASGIDLLSASNGGGLLGGPSDVWNANTDGKTDNATWLWAGQEAIYAFKDEGLATFDTFAVATNASGANPKEYELLAGNDGPTGQFRSVAVCSVANTKFERDPFQKCRFTPVTAKYLKVKLKSTYAGDNTAYATEFKLFGKLE
jgi:hypothetical protein